MMTFADLYIEQAKSEDYEILYSYCRKYCFISDRRSLDRDDDTLLDNEIELLHNLIEHVLDVCKTAKDSDERSREFFKEIVDEYTKENNNK